MSGNAQQHAADICVVHQADCFNTLTSLPSASIDLCYLDPPFNTGRPQRLAAQQYDDRWPSLDAYLDFMRPRIDQIHRVLKPTGSILLHCDWRTCHHFRMMLDSIFGECQFVNHLIWKYGLGGSSPRRFARKHDDILFYGRTHEYHFAAPMVASTSRRMAGRPKKATDVIDIPAVNNMAAERLGYPTQKPIALLRILVEACCPVDGIVLDPFCGSGTTLEAAHQTGRYWIGVDRNPAAVVLASKRLRQAGAILTDA